MQRTLQSTAVTLVVALTLVSCGSPKDARALWRAGVEDCARTDLLGGDVVFLGPSNTLGPGTTFQELRAGIQVSHPFEEYSGQNAPALVHTGGTFSCGSDQARSMDLKAGVSLESALSVSAEIGAQLKRASKVAVKADSLQWDELFTSPYRDHVLRLPQEHAVKTDLLRNRHMVLARALKVVGMVATLEFSSATGVDVKGQVPDGVIPSVHGGVKFGGAWDGTTRLTLTAPSAFYVAGELRHFLETGLSGGAASQIGPIVGAQERFVIIRNESGGTR